MTFQGLILKLSEFWASRGCALQPPLDEVQQLYLESLEACGINPRQHDIRFEEDNWESPTLGAWGIGWQVMFDGMEISQFTYFQHAGALLKAQLVWPALEHTLKCSHLFNILDSSNSIGVTERTAFILRIRHLAIGVAKTYVEGQPLSAVA